MLVYPDGKIFGTIGGGRIEKKVIEDALSVLKSQVSVLRHYDLLKDLQMSCGGSMDVYIAKLRKYLKEDPNVEILNIHGTGFKLIEKK